MSISYFVRYQGLSDRLTQFADYYRTRHAEILKDFPGLKGLSLHTPADWSDPFPVNPDPTEFLAQMTFASDADLTRALESEARMRAREDFANLPRAATVTHQAMRTVKVV